MRNIDSFFAMCKMAVARPKCTFELNARAWPLVGESVYVFGKHIKNKESSEYIFNYFLIRSVSLAFLVYIHVQICVRVLE